MSQDARPVSAFERAEPAGRRPVPAGAVWFVSRHPGAAEWAARRGLAIDRWIAHLDIDAVKPGDTVIGTLPVNLTAEVCRRGARYFNLSLDLPQAARGRELTVEELECFGARLELFFVEHELCASGFGQLTDAEPALCVNGQAAVAARIPPLRSRHRGRWQP